MRYNATNVLRAIAVAILIAIAVIYPAESGAQIASAQADLTNQREWGKGLAASQPSFIQNGGQWNRNVRYLLQRQNTRAWFTARGVHYDITGKAGGGHVLLQRFIGASNVAVQGLTPVRGTFSYLYPSDMCGEIQGMPGFAEVTYSLYPGISARYYTRSGGLKYDVVVHPGADPGAIRIAYDGAEGVRIGPNGELRIRTSVGDVVEEPPVAYQEKGDRRIPVRAEFVVSDKGVIEFRIGSYDTTLPLTIDPAVLFSSYIGGDGNDEGRGVAVDRNGNIYVTGTTTSTDFPTTVGAYSRKLDSTQQRDIFVSKFDPTGRVLLYSTYIGGRNPDDPSAIRVLPDGTAIVAGTTLSNNFPVTHTPSFLGQRGSADGFVLALDSAGRSLKYAVYLGGAQEDFIEDLAVDAQGSVIVIGSTHSSNFPVKPGSIGDTWNGGNDAFVVKLNNTATALLYGTFIGGSGEENATGVALGDGGSLFITGWTTSKNDFPTTATAYRDSVIGKQDAFLLQLEFSFDQTIDILAYSTLIGGAEDDRPTAIALDSLRHAPYITGVTASADYPNTIGGTQGAWFITKPVWPPNGAMDYSRYLSGQGRGSATTLQVDSLGIAYLAGMTESQTALTLDIQFIQLSANGKNILHTQRIGGGGDDIPWHQSHLDAYGNLLITGVTASTNFPTTPFSHDTTLSKGILTAPTDAFVVRYGFYARPSVAGPLLRAFDTLRCDSSVLDTFYIYNNGDTPLAIEAHEFENEDRRFSVVEPPSSIPGISINSGDSVRYIVRFSSQSSIDTATTLLIFTNDSVIGKNPLRIGFRAVRRVPTVTAEPVVQFGSVLTCADSVIEIRLTNGSADGSITIDTITINTAASGVFTVIDTNVFPLVIPFRGTSTIKVRFTPADAIAYAGLLTVEIANCKGARTQVQLDGKGEKAELAIGISGDTLRFPSLLQCHSQVDTTILIRNTGTTPLKIDSATIAGEGFVVIAPNDFPVTLGVGEERELTLRFQPFGEPGVYSADITVYASPCGLQRTIRLRGDRSEPNPLSIVPGPIVFDTLRGCKGLPLSDEIPLTLVNAGTETVILGAPQITASFVSLTGIGAFPNQIDGNGEIEFRLRYAPLTSGRSVGELRIPYQVGECRDTIRVLIDGVREDLILTAEADTIALSPSLGECEFTREMTIRLINSTGVDLNVDDVIDSEWLEYIDQALPIVVPAHSERAVQVRFRPRSAGTLVESITFVSTLCGSSITVHVTGTTTGIIATLDREELEFTPVVTCAVPSLSLDTIYVTWAGENANPVLLHSAIIEGGTFAIDNEADIIGAAIPEGSGLPIALRFTTTLVGDYTGTLKVVVGPCNDTLELQLHGIAVEPTLKITGGSFGSVQVNTTGNGAVMLRNDLPVPVDISNIPLPNAPFTEAGRNGPMLLQPAASITLDLEFTPLAAGDFYDTIYVQVGEPCSFTFPVPLSGRGISTLVDTVYFCLRDGSYNGLVGDTVDVFIDALQERSLLPPGDVTYVLDIDRRRLQLLEANAPAGVTPTMQQGKLILVQNGITTFTSGQIHLRFRLLAGRGETTELQLSSVIGNFGDTIVVLPCDNLLAIGIADRCIVTGAVFGKYPNYLGSVTPNPAGSMVEIEFQQLESVRTILSIWDVAGNLVLRPFDSELEGGRYVVRIDISDLPSGVYYYGIEAGRFHDVQQLIISR